MRRVIWFVEHGVSSTYPTIQMTALTNLNFKLPSFIQQLKRHCHEMSLFWRVIIIHFSFLVEIRIRIRAFVLRWILILPQASIILAGWTQTGSLDLCSGWIYSFVNLNYKCCTFFVPSSPFVDISKACHWHSNIFMSPGKPDKLLYLNWREKIIAASYPTQVR